MSTQRDEADLRSPSKPPSNDASADQRYRFLAETSPVQLWTALPDGNLDYVTGQTASKLGLTPERLLADGWQNVVHPEDLPRAIERWVHALRTGETYEVEFRLKLASGEYAWHLVRAVAQRDASGVIVRWFGTNTNIEDERAQQRRIRDLLREVEEKAVLLREQNRFLELARRDAEGARAELRSLFMQAPAPICVMRGPEHVYEFVNQPYMDLIGRHRVVMGRPIREVRTDLAGLGLFEILDHVYRTGERYVGQRRVHIERDEGPEEAIIEFVYDAFRGLDGQIAGVLVIAFDVTATVRARESAQAALEERERVLGLTEDARSKAELANRAKDEFLATASHELRTPLNAILGWARILRGGSVDPSGFMRGLETIERNAKVQVQLVDDILDGSRIITGKLHLEVRAIDLTAVVQAALDAVRPAAAARNIALEVALDPAAAHIKGDPDRLQQVVWNLVNNAIKFTPKGGRVEVRARRSGTHIEVSVKDNGEGIATDFLPHVFERFRQADGSTTRRHGGLGLGLALVRHLIEAHGGTVRAESEGEGKGAAFTLTLPVLAVLPETVEPTSRPTPVGAPPRVTLSPDALGDVRVLVIDDEPDARELVAAVLRTKGAEVLIATSVDQAIDLLERCAPHVIVSDIGMPITDGYALLERVRALGTRAAKTPAIALTAYAREEDRRRAIDAGFQAYLAKPVDPEGLAQLVGEVARSLAKELTIIDGRHRSVKPEPAS